MTEQDFIIEVLDLFKSKIKNNNCTKEQTDALYKVASENLPIFASAEEIAEHYGKSLTAVHSVIKNKMTEKPRRNLTLYNFKLFRRLVPSSWQKPH